MLSETTSTPPNRRAFLHLTTTGIAGCVASLATSGMAEPSTKPDKEPGDRGKPTKFQIACMTLPYASFSLERALTGIKAAGFEYVAWGTTHQGTDGKRIPVLAGDAPTEKAKELAKQCRALGLEPVMMFGPSPENVAAFKQRIRQAAAAGVGQILTMGSTRGNDRKLWVKNLRELGSTARENGILIVVKQHGGNTGTGAACAEIIREVNDAGVKVNYDAGNVLDYHHMDPIPDLKKCADEVRSFCIKDHRQFPKVQDCGPGLGQIDHYSLLHAVAFRGWTLPLCCENIFAPLVPRPDRPEAIDSLARRAREFLEIVTLGLQT